MTCITEPNLVQTYGDFDSDMTRNLMLVFEKCDNLKSKLPCKSDAEIEEWMQSKYFVILTNQKKFITHLFEDESIEKSSKIKWYKLDPKRRVDYVHQIKRTSFELHDDTLDLGTLNAQIDNGFFIERMPSRDMGY